jgi:hypothetical protein
LKCKSLAVLRIRKSVKQTYARISKDPYNLAITISTTQEYHIQDSTVMLVMVCSFVGDQYLGRITRSSTGVTARSG